MAQATFFGSTVMPVFQRKVTGENLPPKAKLIFIQILPKGIFWCANVKYRAGRNYKGKLLISY
jgi:hypothetical protein